MNIVHVATRFRDGGAERNIINQLEVEGHLGHTVHLVVGADSTPDLLPAGVTVDRIASLGRNPALRDVRAVIELRRLYHRIRPDLIVTHQAKAGIVGRLAAVGTQTVCIHWIHSLTFGPSQGARAGLYRVAERVMAPRAFRLVSVGRELADRYHAAGVGRRSQYRIIRSPIDIEAYAGARSLSAEARRVLRGTLALGGTEPVLLSVGSLDRRKRAVELISWLRPLLESKKARLVMLGDGPDRALVERLAKEFDPDRVVVPGRVTNVADYLAAAACLVHAAPSEGVSQVVIQAIAAGLPVVATDVCGLREVDGATVAVVAADGAGYAAAVEAALRAPRQEVVAVSALDDWRLDSVRRALTALLDEVEAYGRGPS